MNKKTRIILKLIILIIVIAFIHYIATLIGVMESAMAIQQMTQSGTTITMSFLNKIKNSEILIDIVSALVLFANEINEYI